MSTAAFDTLTARDGTNSVPQATVFSGTAKAWFNLNGEGTIAANDDFNMSSYTDNATGSYTCFISSDMSADTWSGGGVTEKNARVQGGSTARASWQLAGAVWAWGTDSSTTALDIDGLCMAIVGDLA